MNNTSIGPEQDPANSDSPLKRTPPHDVDAQKASEFDMERGLAGAEAKPFRPQNDRQPSPSENPPSSDKNPEGSAGSSVGLVSGRRNAGRSSSAIASESDGQT